MVPFAALLLIGAASAPAQQSAAETDILALPNGAVVLSASSEYGGGWAANGLLDGSTATGWCSEQGKPFPHTIIVELPQVFEVSSLTVDNTGVQEAGYPGISAKDVTVYASTTSAGAGFTRVAVIEALRGGRRELALRTPVKARWLKFEVTSNWGNTDYTEIMELEAAGTPVGSPAAVDVAGVYDTNYGLMRIDQDGSRISGCYYGGAGQLTGTVRGPVMELEWRQDGGKRVGSAIMVLSSGGDALYGVWYEGGHLAGEWSGRRSNAKPDCTPSGGGVAGGLAREGRAVVYGIRFDSDSAALKPESEGALREVLAALETQPSLKLVIAGHTDATNTDAHNLRLSRQRAEAVLSWLVDHGIARDRLTAKGFGSSQPVADNATAAGRALNRRVELVVQR
jgi:outer membrane protein OmpA-like peptidoglycan-associated protein